MKILVLIKAVPRMANITFNNDFTIARNKAKLELNPIDVFALEEALRLKEQYGAEVIVASLGNSKSKAIIRKAIAMGADKGILVCDDKYRGSDTYATAYILSELVKNMKDISLVIAGKQSSDGSTSQVPIELATILNIDFAYNAIQCKIINQDEVQCVEVFDSGNVTTNLKLPAVISVAKDANIPRIPSVEQLIYSKQVEIEEINNEMLKIKESECGVKGSLTHVIKTEQINVYKDRKQEKYTDIEKIEKSITNIITMFNC